MTRARLLALAFACGLVLSAPAAGEGRGVGARSSLSWTQCGALECASLRVPLRYDRPGAGSLRLALARVPARAPESRIGSLVVNFGGPGASGRSFLEAFARTLPDPLRDRFDLVLYDPRGVGRSEGMRCDLDVHRLLALDDRVSPRPELALAREAWRLLKPCADRNRATVAFLGTANAARDLDRLRAATGDERLTFLGFSYGTRLGSVYAHLFPARVRALVLDGGVSPSVDWRKLSRDGAAATEAAFARFFSACAAACASGPAKTLWRRAIASLSRDPVRLGGAVVGPAYLELAASVVLAAGHGEFGFLARLAQEAANATGEGARRAVASKLTALVDAGIGSGAEVAARIAIDCADQPGRPPDAVALVFERELSSRYPLAGATSVANCPPAWPRAIEPLPRVRAGAARPVVVVGTRLDPVTPYGWSVELARALRSAVLVTAEGDTHTSFAQGSTCLDPLVTVYLVTGRAPRPVTCPA